MLCPCITSLARSLFANYQTDFTKLNRILDARARRFCKGEEPRLNQDCSGSILSNFMNWSKSGRIFSSSDSIVVSVAIPIHLPLRT